MAISKNKKQVDEGLFSGAYDLYKNSNYSKNKQMDAQTRQAYELGYKDFRQRLLMGLRNAAQSGMIVKTAAEPAASPAASVSTPSYYSENIDFSFNNLNKLIESKILKEAQQTIAQYVVDFANEQTKGFVSRSQHMPQIKQIALDIDKNYDSKRNTTNEEDIKKLWAFIWAWNLKGRKEKDKMGRGNKERKQFEKERKQLDKERKQLERIKWLNKSVKSLEVMLKDGNPTPETATSIQAFIKQIQKFLAQEYAKAGEEREASSS